MVQTAEVLGDKNSQKDMEIGKPEPDSGSLHSASAEPYDAQYAQFHFQTFRLKAPKSIEKDEVKSLSAIADLRREIEEAKRGGREARKSPRSKSKRDNLKMEHVGIELLTMSNIGEDNQRTETSQPLPIQKAEAVAPLLLPEAPPSGMTAAFLSVFNHLTTLKASLATLVDETPDGAVGIRIKMEQSGTTLLCGMETEIFTSQRSAL